MLSKRNWHLFLLIILIVIILSILNLIYFKTLFYTSLLHSGQLLEFNFSHTLHLFYVEFVIYFIFFCLVAIIIFSKVLVKRKISGLYIFESNILIFWCFQKTIIIWFYYFFLSELIENFIVTSNINSSSLHFIFNPSIIEYFVIKLYFHLISLILLSIIVLCLPVKMIYLCILTIHIYFIFLLIIIEIFLNLNQFYATKSIKFKSQR